MKISSKLKKVVHLIDTDNIVRLVRFIQVHPKLLTSSSNFKVELKLQLRKLRKLRARTSTSSSNFDLELEPQLRDVSDPELACIAVTGREPARFRENKTKGEV